jgi:hypothetical protein
MDTFNDLWDVFIQEDTLREIIKTINNEIPNQALNGKVRKEGNKGGPKKGHKEHSCTS